MRRLAIAIVAAAFVLGARAWWPAPVAQTRAAAPVQPRPARVVVRQETATITLPASAVLAGPLVAQLGRANAAERAIAEARAGRIDPVELAERLRATTSGHPELGAGLLRELTAERAPQLALPMAQALADLVGDETLRQETVDALRSAGAEARAVGLLALLGRGDPEVVRLAAESFVHDAPDARGTAGFLLNNLPDGFDDDAAVLAAARSALADPGAPARVREEAATLLGRKDSAAADVALLEQLVRDAELAVRTRALAALDQTGADATRLRADFARVAEDPRSPEPLQQMASAWLAAHR